MQLIGVPQSVKTAVRPPVGRIVQHIHTCAENAAAVRKRHGPLCDTAPLSFRGQSLVACKNSQVALGSSGGAVCGVDRHSSDTYAARY